MSPGGATLASLSLLLLLLTLSSSSSSSSSSSPSNSQTAYDILEQYGLPRGLLPQEAESYTLNTATGAFTVRMRRFCRFTRGAFTFRYNQTMSMVISTERLTNIRGVECQRTSGFRPVVEVVRRLEQGDDLIWARWLVNSQGYTTWSIFRARDFSVSPACRNVQSNKYLYSILMKKEEEEEGEGRKIHTLEFELDDDDSS